MLDTPPLRLQWFKRRTSALLGNGSIQNKAVRFGSLEPAHITLVKRSALPLLAVFVLALVMRVSGKPWPREFYALELVSFLITAQILSPLHLRNPERCKAPLESNYAHSARMELRGGDPGVPRHGF